MNDYWLSKAAEAEAELQVLRGQMEETFRNMQQRINDLEYLLIQANINIQTSAIRKDQG
jgi:hypothetical protein